MAHGSERIARALTPGRAEHDAVVLGELLLDDLGRITASRDQAFDALVERPFAE